MRPILQSVVISAVLILVGCTKPSATSDSGKENAGASAQPPDPNSIVVMTVTELEKRLDYAGHLKKEESTADLESKVIKIEGEVRSLEPKWNDEMPNMTIGMIGDIDSVSISVQDHADDFPARYAMRQRVTLHGKLGKYQESKFSEPRKDILWTIVEAGPNPALVMNAVDLANEFKANPEAAATKYEHQAVYVLGEILEPDEIDRSVLSPLYTNVILKGADGVDLKMVMTTLYIKELGWKSGSKVQILGLPSTELAQEGDRSFVEFRVCSPVVTKLPPPVKVEKKE